MNISHAYAIACRLAVGHDIEPKIAVTALRVLELEGGDEGADFAETIYTARPGLLNYDEKGNYVGNVANENGWTA
jgi:hypothetical protein